MDNLKTPLKNLGFTPKEVEIYIALLELGGASYTDLASHTDIKRTTLYTIVQKMRDRGIVSYSVDERKLSATKPDELFAQLQQNTMQFHRLIPQLKELGKSDRSISRVKFYSGAEGIKQAYLTKKAKLPLKKDRIRRVVSDGTVWDSFWDEHDPKFTEQFLKEAKYQGYSWRVLATGSQAKAYSKKITREFGVEVKMLPENYTNEFDMEIGPDYLILADLKSKQPYAIKIISTELARAMATFFDFSWDQYQPA